MTDKELRKEFLERAYRYGARYVARDLTGEIYAYEDKPSFDSDGCWWDASEDLTKVIVELTYFEDLFQDLRMNIETLLDIGKELEIVDWKNVPVDTPVLVSADGEIWERAYFKQYVEVNIDPFIAFADGRTSWSKKGMVDWHAWKYCKLAEVNDENKL